MTETNHARDKAKLIQDLTALGLFHVISAPEEILPTPKIVQLPSRVCGMSVLEEKLQKAFVYAASFYTHVSAPSDRRLAPLPNAARDQWHADSRQWPRLGGRTARLSDSDGPNQWILVFLLFLFNAFCATTLKTASNLVDHETAKSDLQTEVHDGL